MDAASAWEEAFDEASQTTYYFNRITGETSWTPPTAEAPSKAADSESLWRQAFDEVSQTSYYYHVHSGETSWTLPMEEDDGRDFTVVAFAALALQARFRGHHGRRAARRLLCARYQVSTDQETGVRVFTDVKTHVATTSRPLLFARLGILEGQEDAPDDEDGAHDSDSEDFDALEDEEALEPDANGGEEAEGGPMMTLLASTKKKRRFPRSKAQQLVDYAEDNADTVTTLDLSGLDAFKLSSRIWNLQRLTVLVLVRNKLARLPSGIQDLTQLEELDVSHNLLARLPSCLQTTETLRVLRAPFNRIASFSPRLWKLRELRELDLSSNSLKELPFVEGDLALLRETREWQVGVGLLRALEVLKLAHNQLATAPVSIGQCQALVVLDLSYNALKGALSDEIASLAALKELHLAHNSISELTEGIGELTQLERLDLSHNSLRSLPDGIGGLSRLKTLDLSHNELRALPEAFGALESLEALTVNGNPRFMALGGFLRRLGRLERASFANCAVTRIESPDVFRDAPIRELVLANNMLGAFALRLGEDSLETLDISGNQLEHAPGEVLEHCRRLRVLNLSENRLTQLPATIGRQATLETLDLSGNSLELLPDELTQCAALRELRCSHNYLAVLPTRLGMLRKLERLHVAFNRLTVLPSSLRELRTLKCVYANDNSLAVPPPSLHYHARDASHPCFFEMSNNPFTRVKPVTLTWKEAFARAVTLIDARQFAQGEQKLSELMRSSRSTSSPVDWGELTRCRPRWHFQRALSRVLQLAEARRAIDSASERVAQLETALTAAELLADRQRYLEVKKLMAKKPADNQEEQRERLDTSDDARKEAGSEIAERPEDDDDERTQHEAGRQELAAARQEQAAAVRRHETLARGALMDLLVAIVGKINEAPTALYLQGIAHMARGEYADAARSFTAALRAIQSLPTATSTGDVVARESVHVFERRAEAFSRLGQLPRALGDLRRVLSRFPIEELGEQRREALEEMEREITRLREAQRAEYFVDDHETCRAFDVEPSLGLPRRPEVTDVINDADVDDASVKLKNKKKQITDATALPVTALTPAQRFARDVAIKSQALYEADERARAAFDSVRAANATHLARAKDFKREVRETLRLETEEARQRAVEAELARLAAELAAEREREFQEKLFMKYEDEYAAWLAAELARLEAERLRRLEIAQHKQEAQAAYEKRLARRGGRRQAQPRRK